MNAIREWLEGSLGLSPALQGRLASTLVAVLILWLVQRLAQRVVRRHVEDVRQQYHWRKGLAYVAGAIGLLIIGRIWFAGIGSIATFLGLLSAGVAIALKDLLVNLAGWGFILWRRPFAVGDRIEIGTTAGDVIDLRLFQFTVMEIGNWVDADQSTGRVVHVPNGAVFSLPLANYSKGFAYIWNEIPILVTFESDWRRAKALLVEIAERHATHLTSEAERRLREVSGRFMIFYANLTPTVYTSVQDSGVLLTIRYLCDPQKRRGTAQAIWEDVLDAFAARSDVDFAYPTQRFFANPTEGKPDTGGPPVTR